MEEEFKRALEEENHWRWYEQYTSKKWQWFHTKEEIRKSLMKKYSKSYIIEDEFKEALKREIERDKREEEIKEEGMTCHSLYNNTP